MPDTIESTPDTAPAADTVATATTPEAPEPATPAAPADPWDDPAAARLEIEKLRRENGSERINAKATAAADARQQLLKDLGLVKDDEPADPQLIAEQLTAAQASATASALELAIYKAAGAAKADPAALLDSRDFLAKISGIDPTDTEALAAAIGEASTSNPRFKVTQAATVGGANFSGGAAPARTFTRAQIADTAYYTANRTDILAALSTGRITE